MNRWTALKVLAPTLALLAAMAPAPASAAGGPVGGFVLPPGSTATFSGAVFTACNNLGWGYQLNLGPEQLQASRQGNCVTPMTAPDVTIGPFATPTSLRLFLRDITCTATYYSDGTPVDHVIVSGSNPYLVRFADAGGFCEKKFIPILNFTGQNFKVTLTITDLCKDQDMDSQLNLVCEQEGQHGGAHEGDGSAGDGGAHEGDGRAGNANHADGSVQSVKATQVGQNSGATVRAGNVEHATKSNHANSQGQSSKSNQDS